jgi:hypothetical protein
MDTVSNVLSGYFATGPAASMRFVTAIADGRDPKLANRAGPRPMNPR